MRGPTLQARCSLETTNPQPQDGWRLSLERTRDTLREGEKEGGKPREDMLVGTGHSEPAGKERSGTEGTKGQHFKIRVKEPRAEKVGL